jgi:hypothetical protein
MAQSALISNHSIALSLIDAGAGVTATGVFVYILRVAAY